jgi:hypothetical protein
MKRQFIALFVVLAVALQGSVAAFAGNSSAMYSDCRSAVESPSDFAHKSCCPDSLYAMSCCLDACVASVALTVSPASLVWYGRTAQPRQFRAATFSSRGDSPLIRPPIP